MQLTLIFKANEDFSKTDQNHTVAYYLAGKDEVCAFSFLPARTSEGYSFGICVDLEDILPH